MAFRTVSREEASNTEQAKAVVVADTGGACIPTGVVKEISGGWAVEVYSLDGQAAMPLHAVRALAVLGKDADGNDLKERSEFESVGPNPTDNQLSEMRRNAAELHKLLK